ncbi:MAG: hypothetical protein AB7G37_01075 [Solirubrobacteraceae bacterium]
MPPAELVIDMVVAVATITVIVAPVVWLADRILERLHPTTPREVRTPGSTSRARRAPAAARTTAACGPIDGLAEGWITTTSPDVTGPPTGDVDHESSTRWRPAREAPAAGHPDPTTARSAA